MKAEGAARDTAYRAEEAAREAGQQELRKQWLGETNRGTLEGGKQGGGQNMSKSKKLINE